MSMTHDVTSAKPPSPWTRRDAISIASLRNPDAMPSLASNRGESFALSPACSENVSGPSWASCRGGNRVRDGSGLKKSGECRALAQEIQITDLPSQRLNLGSRTEVSVAYADAILTYSTPYLLGRGGFRPTSRHSDSTPTPKSLGNAFSAPATPQKLSFPTSPFPVCGCHNLPQSHTHNRRRRLLLPVRVPTSRSPARNTHTPSPNDVTSRSPRHPYPSSEPRFPLYDPEIYTASTQTHRHRAQSDLRLPRPSPHPLTPRISSVSVSIRVDPVPSHTTAEATSATPEQNLPRTTHPSPHCRAPTPAARPQNPHRVNANSVPEHNSAVGRNPGSLASQLSADWELRARRLDLRGSGVAGFDAGVAKTDGWLKKQGEHRDEGTV
uniref:Uncharacterized protein n=1 Tax=Mycena chlorophos TaxID=658473 RepID=A0ABQ0LQN4_MYCCL|nr:predicted protein [Mycena chlorophos]